MGRKGISQSHFFLRPIFFSADFIGGKKRRDNDKSKQGRACSDKGEYYNERDL
jgi:hypothetical protein